MRLEPELADVTLLYHPPTREWRKVVLLQEAFTTLEQVRQILPGVARVWLIGRPFVGVSYQGH